MPVAEESFCHRRHHSLSWDLEQCEVPLHYVKLSMLWDDNPPENALQGLQGRVLSEHELRVQRSLQQLNVPDWYKNSSRPAEGFLLKRGSDASSAAGRRGAGGWPGLGVKTTSLSSLRSPTTAVRLGSSPSPPPQAFTRWSSSRLHSAGSASATPSTSPCGSARSSFNHRQPYLGWRSQERLSGTPRTPAERLAQGLLEQREHQRQQDRLRGSSQLQSSSPNLSDVRSSIKEVTSAIVHYVSAANGPGSNTDVRLAGDSSGAHSVAGRDREDQPRGHSNQRVCWIESSFVGSRPIEQPQTPDEGSVSTSPLHHQELYLDLKQPYRLSTSTCATGASGALPSNGPNTAPGPHQSHGVAAAAVASPPSPASPAAAVAAFGPSAVISRPSPSSTTMEDVLDSLLGLPPPSRSPSPGPNTASNASSSSQQVSVAQVQVQPAQHPGHQASLRTCADIRPDPAGSASGGAGGVSPRGVDGHREEEDADDGPEPAGWEAADLAGVEAAAAGGTSSGAWRAAQLPGWDDALEPALEAPPGWQGAAVVGMLAEEGSDSDCDERDEAEFGAALLSLPLDTRTAASRRRRSESSALEHGERGESRRHSLGPGRSKAPRKPPRHVSFDLTAGGGGTGGALEPGTVACRRHGCDRVEPEASARTRFKTCKNCAHTYCSRECRREHWDSHKRACAIQRVGALIRRVVARVRGDTAVLSTAARRGYKAQGRGVVRLLFHSADAAEAYCAGEVAVGSGPGQELVFVRWADLPAEELGAALHGDLTRLCNTYNPRKRAITLVVLAVLSEAPSENGVVMWERQLVSRVSKVRLFREEQMDGTLVLVGALATHADARPAVLRNIIKAVEQRGVDLRDKDRADAFLCVKDFVDGRGLVPLKVGLGMQGGGCLLVVLVPNVPADTAATGISGPDTETVNVSGQASDTED